MNAELVEFGKLEIEGERYNKDVVIDGGRIRKRDKGPSKALPHRGRHTPLTAAEQIPLPWSSNLDSRTTNLNPQPAPGA